MKRIGEETGMRKRRKPGKKRDEEGRKETNKKGIRKGKIRRREKKGGKKTKE